MRIRAALAHVALAAALALPLPAMAQTAAPAAAPQILTLDQDRLYAGSLYGKAMEARAAAEGQSLATENRKLEADLAAEEADLTKRRATLTPTAFQALADAFDAKVEQVRSQQAAKADALKADREAGRKAFFSAAVPVLAELMRQLGAYAILNHDAVVLSFDAIDVTDRAIKALDDKLGDGSTLGSGPRIGTVPEDGSGTGLSTAPEGGVAPPAP